MTKELVAEIPYEGRGVIRVFRSHGKVHLELGDQEFELTQREATSLGLELRNASGPGIQDLEDRFFRRGEKLQELEVLLQELGLTILKDNWPYHIIVATENGLFSVYYLRGLFEVQRLTESGVVDETFSEISFVHKLDVVSYFKESMK